LQFTERLKAGDGSMSKIFRFDCYPHDWLLDTSRLTPEDRGIYVQIVMLIYARGGQIDNDPRWISGSCNCSSRLVAASISRLVQLDFIQLSNGKISQKRAERELKTKRTQIEKGANGGQKSAEKKPESIENKDIPQSVEPTDPPSSNPNPNPIPKSEDPPDPLAVDRHRLVFDLPDDWLKLAVDEMGWTEGVLRDVWTNFGAHYRHAVGQKGFRTDVEWLACWLTWCRKERIPAANAKPGQTPEEPVILTPEEEAKQRRWFRLHGKQHQKYNPEGLTYSEEVA
jgi:uncharacterized protein YdaU (DUF1376 family)